MISKKVKYLIFILPMVLVILYGGCEQKFVKDWDKQPQDMTAAMGVVPDSLQSMNLAPLVKAYHEGGDLYFIHTEVSDSSVANMLTEMMGPRVVHLTKLAQTPDSLLAEIYVFKNGVKGHGPYGFQPDIFGSVPGDSGYSPLRTIHLVRWKDDAEAKELKSVDALMEARKNDRLAIDNTSIVANMPVLVWPGGHR